MMSRQYILPDIIKVALSIATNIKTIASMLKYHHIGNIECFSNITHEEKQSIN